MTLPTAEQVINLPDIGINCFVNFPIESLGNVDKLIQLMLD